VSARVMTTPSDVPLSRLSRELYVRFLHRARALEFAFVRFDDFLAGPPAHQRYVALRHDIDFAPRYSLELAKLEHAAGVAATYFVLTDGQFYNPLEPAVVRQLRRISALGHEIGLHFAVSSAVHDDVGDEVAFRMDLLEQIVGAPVRSFSQHDPVNAGFAAVALPAGRAPCVDAYRVVRDHELLYVSESAMMWREHTFESALEEGRNLCLLAHPHSWLAPEDDYIAMIRRFEGEQADGVAGRFGAFVDGLADYYRRRLEDGA
jgi:hypothetical protein